MTKSLHYDLIFVGGGLASGLAALRLKCLRPEWKSLVLDQRTGVAPQTWSFQSLQHSSSEPHWVSRYVSRTWPSYEVRFPAYSKRVAMPYHSIRAGEFRQTLEHELAADFRSGVRVTLLTPHSVRLGSGEILHARRVIDARGWPRQGFMPAGYQKFLGLTVRTTRPHGLEHPTLMDARVPQLEGFRFLYVLPWSESELLIEDTRYSTEPRLDRKKLRRDILAYAQAQGWAVAEIIEAEEGSLLLPAYGSPRPEPGPVASLGVRAGLFHPTTGYSIFEAVQAADRLATLSSPEDVDGALREWSRVRWDNYEFHRRLNNMLFFAAREDKRYQVLERFYQHPEDLIARFYAGETTVQDKLRILSGKPPLPMRQALYHFFAKRDGLHGTA